MLLVCPLASGAKRFEPPAKCLVLVEYVRFGGTDSATENNGTQHPIRHLVTLAGGIVTTCRTLDDVVAFLATLGVPSRAHSAISGREAVLTTRNAVIALYERLSDSGPDSMGVVEG